MAKVKVSVHAHVCVTCGQTNTTHTPEPRYNAKEKLGHNSWLRSKSCKSLLLLYLMQSSVISCKSCIKCQGKCICACNLCRLTHFIIFCSRYFKTILPLSFKGSFSHRKTEYLFICNNVSLLLFIKFIYRHFLQLSKSTCSLQCDNYSLQVIKINHNS